MNWQIILPLKSEKTKLNKEVNDWVPNLAVVKIY